jgi:hypothetical protein
VLPVTLFLICIASVLCTIGDSSDVNSSSEGEPQRNNSTDYDMSEEDTGAIVRTALVKKRDKNREHKKSQSDRSVHKDELTASKLFKAQKHDS